MRISGFGGGGLAALAAAGWALAPLPASAQDDMMGGVSLSGFINQDLGFGSYDGGVDTDNDFHWENDAEIHFKASGQTDGGLAVAATIELKGVGDGKIDESNLDISGGFGALNLGAQDNAANMHGNAGIGGGYGGGGYYDCGETWTPVGTACGGPLGSPNGGDALGIRYSTPAVGGFQAGLSYQLDSTTEGDTTQGNNNPVLALGANFKSEVGNTNVTVGGGYQSYDKSDATENENSWGFGASVGLGATTLSLRYDIKDNSHTNAVDSTVYEQTQSFGVGVDHTVGALKFGIGYSVRTEENKGNLGTSAVDLDNTLITAGASYALGGGLAVSVGVNSGEVEGIDTDEGCSNPTSTDETMCLAAGGRWSETRSRASVDDVGVGIRIGFSF